MDNIKKICKPQDDIVPIFIKILNPILDGITSPKLLKLQYLYLLLHRFHLIVNLKEIILTLVARHKQMTS